MNVPGIDYKDGEGKANSINDMFINASAHVPPLEFNELPAYLPAKEPRLIYPNGKFTMSLGILILINRVVLTKSLQN